MADDQTFTVKELAKRHGHHQGARVDGDDPHTALHNVASVLNGWQLHEHRTGEVVKLTDAQYLAALDAAKRGKAHEETCKRAPKPPKKSNDPKLEG